MQHKYLIGFCSSLPFPPSNPVRHRPASAKFVILVVAGFVFTITNVASTTDDAVTSSVVVDRRYVPANRRYALFIYYYYIGVMVIKGNLYSFWRNNRSDSTLHFPVLFPFLRRNALLGVSFVANGALIALLYELRPAL